MYFICSISALMLSLLLVGQPSIMAQSSDSSYNNLLKFQDCLYLYMEDGTYDIALIENGKTVKDTYWRGKLEASKVTLINDATQCIDPIKKIGKLAFTYSIDSKDLKSIRISLELREKAFDRYWEVYRAKVSLGGLSNTDIELRSGISADVQYSYACGVQQFQNLAFGKPAREYAVTLKISKFQLQPFAEQKDTVFAAAQDCVVWLTIPSLMGVALTVFIIFVVSIGAYFLQEITTTDLKFSKAGMLMNPSQLDATK